MDKEALPRHGAEAGAATATFAVILSAVEEVETANEALDTVVTMVSNTSDKKQSGRIGEDRAERKRTRQGDPRSACMFLNFNCFLTVPQ